MGEYRGLGNTLNILMHKITLFAVISASITGVFAGDDNNHNHNAYNTRQQDIHHQYECYLLYQCSHIYINTDQSFDSEHTDGKAALSGYSIGAIILSGGTVYHLQSGPGCQYKYFLNIYDTPSSPTSSYKEMKYENGVIVSNYWTNWGVTSASPWGAHNWFLACQSSDPNYWPLYLQTGSDVPSGQNCTLTQLSQNP
ncbi:hypothetical protein FRC00_014185 [Tulasnella sp. 408]|nr:hypothetical protein FRC00_014185 [Tulasnella sp. 408]